MLLRRITLRLSDGLPTEFRLFKAGENETTKGVFVFDEAAAKAVLEAAEARGGVQYPIDLEHLSIDDDARHYDPDARGWFELEVRNGELWAVNVRWTPDGARRLEERTQRYVSPAFVADDEGRVVEIVNVALVSMPATQGTPALVAANRRSRMSLKERKARLLARLSLARAKLMLLADGDDGGDAASSGKFAAIKAAADKAQEALAAIDSASGDVDAAMAAVDAAMSAVDEFEQAVQAMAGGSAGDAPPADPAAEQTAAGNGGDDDDKKRQQIARDRAEVISLRKELARRDEQAKIELLAREMDERRTLVGELVRLGRETPATAWADTAATIPRGTLSTMPISELRTRVETFRKAGTLLGGGPMVPSMQLGGATSPMLDEQEALYIRARHGRLLSLGHKLRPIDDTIERYHRHKAQQIRGAEEKGDRDVAQKLSAAIDARTVALAARAGLVMLSNPVQPFEEFGASSQIAMQNFRLEYNLALASLIGGWSESVGRLLPDGSLRTTFPLNFRALKYQEKTAPNAATGQPLNADIAVQKREFFEGQMVELRRLVKGDFAYVQSWAQLAQDLARARVFLRDELVTTLLEAGTTGYWGSSATLTTGIDGQPFFSATHAVNPFDATMKLRGSATFANYQSAATPLTSINLTSEKNQALQVAAPDGRELGVTYDGILYPSSLEQTAYNLLKVQDLILDAKATLNAVNNVFAGVRNPHFQSGLEQTRAQQLAGTDTTANYYLYSREAIARGLVPWVVAEDPTEEVRLFDESSDFYKNTGFIKWESHVFLNAVLLYPHAVRFVKGS